MPSLFWRHIHPLVRIIPAVHLHAAAMHHRHAAAAGAHHGLPGLLLWLNLQAERILRLCRLRRPPARHATALARHLSLLPAHAAAHCRCRRERHDQASAIRGNNLRMANSFPGQTSSALHYRQLAQFAGARRV